jgi:hypothetical protein
MIFGYPRSKLCVTPPFSINFRYQIENQVSEVDIFLATVAILIGGDQPKDNPCQAWFNLVQGFQRRRFKCESLRRTTSDDYLKMNSKLVLRFTRDQVQI